MGGLEGALANTAEAVYDKFSNREKQAARRIFLQLVRPGEDAANTRRRATFDEMGEEVREIVKRLADARLLVTGHDSGSGTTPGHSCVVGGCGDLCRVAVDDDGQALPAAHRGGV
jgi:hypothetical protein